jgi:hypothetical protein
VSEVIIVRTDHWDEALNAFVTEDLLQADREILVVADESRQRVQVPVGIGKIVADPGRLGLQTTRDVMWRCGDYALYAALSAVPQAAFFWLIEPDVRIHGSDVKSFFDGSGAREKRDFLTASFVEAGPEWMWHRTMTPFAPRVHLCMMQACRISRPAASYLYEQRSRLGEAFETGNLSVEDWPNDEAFVLSMLVQGGFSHARLDDHAPGYATSGSFTFTKPISIRWLQSLPKDNRLYHPVVGGAKFLGRARAYLAERARSAARPDEILEEFDKGFLPQVRMECGDESALVFQDETRKVAGWVARRRNLA